MSGDDEISVAGEIDSALPRAELARVLSQAGFEAEAGVYAMRLRLAGERVEFTRDEVGYILCSGFETPEGRASLPEFSAALGHLGLRHRFEVCQGDELVGYLHHEWALDDNDGGEE